MKNLVLGYSEALYEISIENKCETIFLENLRQLSEIIRDNQDYVRILSSPDVSRDDKVKMINEAFKKGTNIYIINFLKILAENRKIRILPECYEEYKRIYNKRHNIADITVITAVKMSEEQIQKLRMNLQKRINKEISIVNKVDEACIGGIKIIYDSNLIDLSVKNSLDMLRYSL